MSSRSRESGIVFQTYLTRIFYNKINMDTNWNLFIELINNSAQLINFDVYQLRDQLTYSKIINLLMTYASNFMWKKILEHFVPKNILNSHSSETRTSIWNDYVRLFLKGKKALFQHYLKYDKDVVLNRVNNDDIIDYKILLFDRLDDD